MEPSRFCRKLQLLLLISACLIGVDAATQETNQLQQDQNADEEDFKIKVDDEASDRMGGKLVKLRNSASR